MAINFVQTVHEGASFVKNKGHWRGKGVRDSKPMSQTQSGFNLSGEFFIFLFISFNLYLKLTKTSRIYIAGQLHINIATQNVINEC